MTKPHILSLIKERTLLIDGAMGTELIAAGMKEKECPELWGIEHIALLKEIHKSYIDAGADIITSNTFGGTRMKLSSYNLQNRVEEINLKALKGALEICPKDKYAAGDMGPVGAFLPPVGNAKEEEIFDSYYEQAHILKEGGADLLIIETQFDLREALLALKAAKTTPLTVIITMTFDKKKRGFFTMMGNGVEESIKALQEEGANIVGANCTLDSAGYLELTRQIKACAEVPVLVQPNAGQPEIIEDKPVYKISPKVFAKDLRLLVEAGADLIGSCCGSTPLFTKRIKKMLEELEKEETAS